MLDNAGEDEVLDTSIPIVDDQVAQIQQFEFRIESVAPGGWPGASDVVQVNYGMVSSTLSHQDAESGPSRLAGADRSVEEYGVDHLSRLLPGVLSGGPQQAWIISSLNRLVQGSAVAPGCGGLARHR